MEEKKDRRGGARQGAGRPPPRPGEELDSFLHIKCNRADKALWVQAAGSGGLSQWVIETLNDKSRFT